MSAPKSTPDRDRLISLCEDFARLIVQANGGFTIGGEEDMRNVVRMARAMYSEIQTATKPKAPTKRKGVVERAGEDEEWS